ncbi:MAG: ACT domain-containing protein [Arenibacterium sp.]
MIAQMAPARDPGVFVFVTTQDFEKAKRLHSEARAIYQEAEGTSLILPLERADAEGFDTTAPMASITLHVHSALDAVGLTAAVASALAEQEIPCNMVAAYYHDHAYVPLSRAEDALVCLRRLSARASGVKHL